VVNKIQIINIGKTTQLMLCDKYFWIGLSSSKIAKNYQKPPLFWSYQQQKQPQESPIIISSISSQLTTYQKSGQDQKEKTDFKNSATYRPTTN